MSNVMSVNLSYSVRIHSLFSERVTDPLTGHGGQHQGHDVLEPAGQLKHDHHQRHWGTHMAWLNRGEINRMFIKLYTVLGVS